eukprot:5221469-Pleurochrysis_carterae.AAC.1
MNDAPIPPKVDDALQPSDSPSDTKYDEKPDAEDINYMPEGNTVEARNKSAGDGDPPKPANDGSTNGTDESETSNGDAGANRGARGDCDKNDDPKPDQPPFIPPGSAVPPVPPDEESPIF